MTGGGWTKALVLGLLVIAGCAVLTLLTATSSGAAKSAGPLPQPDPQPDPQPTPPPKDQKDGPDGGSAP